MPLYEYECQSCGHRFERIQKMSDAAPTACPKCGADRIVKMVSSPAFQFKGSGWYVTDYARKRGDSSGDSKSSSSKSDGEKSPAGESSAPAKSGEATSDAGKSSDAAKSKDTKPSS